jgi:hypothetical protein
MEAFLMQRVAMQVTSPATQADPGPRFELADGRNTEMPITAMAVLVGRGRLDTCNRNAALGCAGGPSHSRGHQRNSKDSAGSYQERRPHLFSELTCGLATGGVSTVFPFRPNSGRSHVLCDTARSVCSRAGIFRTATVQSADQ